MRSLATFVLGAVFGFLASLAYMAWWENCYELRARQERVSANAR